MNGLPDAGASATERASVHFARIAAVGVLLLLVATLVASFLTASGAGESVFAAALALLLSMPIVNVLSELIDEIARRDWLFAGAAAFVLALILWTAIGKLT